MKIKSLPFIEPDEKRYLAAENNELIKMIDTLLGRGILNSAQYNRAIQLALSGKKIQLSDVSTLKEKFNLLIALRAIIGNTRQSIEDLDGNELITKFESENPFGSHYDRVYLDLIKDHLLRKPENDILEISSGSAGISCAAIANLMRLKLKLVIPDSDYPIRQTLPQRLGATIIPTLKSQGVSGANKILRNVLKSNKKLNNKPWFLNHSHRDDTLPSIRGIMDEVGSVDYFFSAMGNGTTLRGIGARLLEVNPNAKIIGVRYSNPIGSCELQMPGGDEVELEFPHLKAFPPKEVLYLDLDEIKALATSNQLGLTSAAVKLAAQRYIKQKNIRDSRILVIDYDSYERY